MARYFSSTQSVKRMKLGTSATRRSRGIMPARLRRAGAQGVSLSTVVVAATRATSRSGARSRPEERFYFAQQQREMVLHGGPDYLVLQDAIAVDKYVAKADDPLVVGYPAGRGSIALLEAPQRFTDDLEATFHAKPEQFVPFVIGERSPARYFADRGGRVPDVFEVLRGLRLHRAAVGSCRSIAAGMDSSQCLRSRDRHCDRRAARAAL